MKTRAIIHNTVSKQSLLMASIGTVLIMLCMLLLTPTSATASSKSISAEQFIKMPEADRFLLDVRTPGEYQDGYIANAVNIPVASLAKNLDKLKDKDQQIVVYCRSGRRASTAIEYLSSQGFTNLVHLEGDFGEWEANERTITKPKKSATNK
jgi:rhodanese-related sulfurtransferase